MLPLTMTSNDDGLGDEPHGGGVDELVLELHVGVGFADLGRDLAPDLHGLEHVRLVDRRHALAALSGDVEGELDDAPNLVLVVDHRVEAGAKPVPHLLAFGLTEVDSSGELANEHEIDSAKPIGLERRRRLEPTK